MERRGNEPIWSVCLSFREKEFFTTAYKYINETLKDIIRHFHSPCLLCAGWGGKQKGSKHICISESLVPRELLWAVSANLFSALLTAHQQQNHPPYTTDAGSDISTGFWLVRFEAGKSDFRSPDFKWLCMLLVYLFSGMNTCAHGLQPRKAAYVSPPFSVRLMLSWHGRCNRVGQDRSGPLSPR